MNDQQNRNERAKEGTTPAELERMGGYETYRGEVVNPDSSRGTCGGKVLEMRQGQARPVGES